MKERVLLVQLFRALASLVIVLPAVGTVGAELPRNRVASLNLSADEVLVEILPQERLVSVTRWVDDPGTSNVVGQVPATAYRFQKADMERLVALSPDLVIVSEYTDADFLRLVEKSGIRWHRMQGLDSPPGVRAAIAELGHVVGADAAARRVLARYDATLADLARRLEGAQRPRVLYWSGEMTAGADTAIGALIETAGAVNVGREMGVQGIAPPGAERAFVSDPDVILVSSWPGGVQAVKEHPLLSGLRAVRQGHIVTMPNELLVALSQYTANACWDLASRLHPDRVPRQQP
ncbi:MAG: ABC transporter substrate-binding protein [Thermoplasmata archaeon]|nr:ABC transporter substrate-binding protein [Thermoplasmata archaeon]